MKCIPERVEDLTRNVVTLSFVPLNKSLAIVMLYPVDITTDTDSQLQGSHCFPTIKHY